MLGWVGDTGATELDLSECCEQPGHRLTYIPSNLGMAASLELLDLSNQNLTATEFPNQTEFSALSRLTTLKISGNALLTELPSGLRGLASSLEVLLGFESGMVGTWVADLSGALLA